MAYFVRQQCTPASGFYQAFYFPTVTSGNCTVQSRWFGRLWSQAAEWQRRFDGGSSVQPRSVTPDRQHGSRSSSTGATHMGERPTAVNNPNTSDWVGGHKTPQQGS
jgi:hypothetical protein